MIKEIKLHRINNTVDKFISELLSMGNNFNYLFYYNRHCVINLSHLYKTITIHRKSLPFDAKHYQVLIEKINNKYNKNNYEIKIND